MHLFNDPVALIAAGYQVNDADHVYGEPRGADEDALMAEEVSDLMGMHAWRIRADIHDF